MPARKNQRQFNATQRYNVFRAAEMLGVHERTVRYWIKKCWIKPSRDYRNYPVFTDEDIRRIEEWRNTLRKP